MSNITFELSRTFLDVILVIISYKVVEFHWCILALGLKCQTMIVFETFAMAVSVVRHPCIRTLYVKWTIQPLSPSLMVSQNKVVPYCTVRESGLLENLVTTANCLHKFVSRKTSWILTLYCFTGIVMVFLITLILSWQQYWHLYGYSDCRTHWSAIQFREINIYIITLQKVRVFEKDKLFDRIPQRTNVLFKVNSSCNSHKIVGIYCKL